MRKTGVEKNRNKKQDRWICSYTFSVYMHLSDRVTALLLQQTDLNVNKRPGYCNCGHDFPPLDFSWRKPIFLGHLVPTGKSNSRRMKEEITAGSNPCSYLK